jgi:hypothetical protein
MQSPMVKTMANRTDFAILKSVNKTPSMASCTKCRRKFFTPNTYYNDPIGAEQYLRTKFDLHDCLIRPGGARSRLNLERDSPTKPY